MNTNDCSAAPPRNQHDPGSGAGVFQASAKAREKVPATMVIRTLSVAVQFAPKSDREKKTKFELISKLPQEQAADTPKEQHQNQGDRGASAQNGCPMITTNMSEQDGRNEPIH